MRIDGNSINHLVKAASYAVRGPIVSRAAELANQMKDGKVTMPFKQFISCNIGNPHALDQKYISYIRDVLSVVLNPSLRNAVAFPKDVLRRADRYLSQVPSIGAYSESKGIAVVREEVAEFLYERDGYRANTDNIYLTNGASEGVRLCMQLLLRNPSSGFKDGVLAPIPQYPLYSALTTLLQGTLIPYHLDESNNWSCSQATLKSSFSGAQTAGVTPRGIVVINPGNPTGQILSEDNMKHIIEFCLERNICLMADEVYQENIWKPDAKFVSFRKVAYDMGVVDGSKGLQLISFHSISKGFIGECGLRGGYFELIGMPPEVSAEIYKLASISLCSNTIGQIATGLMVRPPKEGEESFELYHTEKHDILQSLHRRSVLLSDALNKLPGISCTSIEGAMYAFPTIDIPEKAIQAAKAKGIEADAMYCMELLENTGIIVVPGSGFGQVDGTYHFRTTILPPEDKIQDVIELLKKFHLDFLKRYA